MKFKTKTKDLKEVVLSVSRAVDVKPSTPSLQGLYIKVEDGSCEVIGSDLDLVIKAKFNVDSMVGGECLVNARILSEVVRKMSSGEIVFSDLGSEVMIEADKSEYKLRKLDHLTYPKALLENSFEQGKSQKLAPFELFTALRKVGIAASPEGGKPILTGVFFDNDGEKTTLVSTDSYRLATNIISNLPIDDAGIVSYRSLNETIKIFEDSEQDIFINSTERELHFYNEKYYTSVRKLEGNYPEYKALFPKENVFSIEVDKKKILKVVDENNLNISSTNKDIGGGVEEIDINVLGLEVGDVTDFQISFNPNYLIQGIEVLDGNKAYLRFSGNDKPAVIQGEEETYQYLLMPVRTNE